MRLISELMNSDVGQMSAVVIGITLCMGAYYLRYFLKHMHDDEAAARRGKG